MGSRSRQYPNLTHFLQFRSAAFRQPNLLPLGCFAASIVSYGAFFLTLPELGFIRAGLFAFLFVLPAGAYISSRFLGMRSRPKTPEAERAALVSETLQALYAKAQRKRMARELEPTAGTLLEESARHWGRVQAALSGHFWSSESLPSHWQAVRDRSWSAANAGMDELVLLLRPLALSVPQVSHGEGVIDTIMDAVFDREAASPSAQLPAGFEPARLIAERLKLLAGEVERASRELADDQIAQGEVQSAAALESCLAELKSLREAEAELDQHLEQGN